VKKVLIISFLLALGGFGYGQANEIKINSSDKFVHVIDTFPNQSILITSDSGSVVLRGEVSKNLSNKLNVFLVEYFKEDFFGCDADGKEIIDAKILTTHSGLAHHFELKESVSNILTFKFEDVWNVLNRDDVKKESSVKYVIEVFKKKAITHNITAKELGDFSKLYIYKLGNTFVIVFSNREIKIL
jgi:hypothetical protein